VAQAAGNLASKPTELTLAANTIKLTFSQTKFELETGKYYKLIVSSDGHERSRSEGAGPVAKFVGQLY